jgi:hypothetical protein
MVHLFVGLLPPFSFYANGFKKKKKLKKRKEKKRDTSTPSSQIFIFF